MQAAFCKLQPHAHLALLSFYFPGNGHSLSHPSHRNVLCSRRSIATPLSFRANASSKEPGLKDTMESLRGMPLKALKEELARLGIKYTDCFEKEELIRRLASAYGHSKKGLHTDKALVELPMQRLRGTPTSPKEYILLPLIIGDQGPFNFLLDTGTSTTIISPVVAYDILHLQQDSGNTAYGIGGTGTTIYGTKSVELPPVRIMEFLCEPVHAVVMDLSTTVLGSKVAGLVGMNVLSQFDVEFDFLSQRLRFYASGATSKNRSIISNMQRLLTFSVNFGIPSIQVKIGKGIPQPAILDFGSSHNVSSLGVALDSGFSMETLKKGATFGCFSISGAQTTLYAAEMDVQILTENEGKSSQKLLFNKTKFAVGDLPPMAALGANIILGPSLFDQSRIIVSMSTHSIYAQIPAAMAG